MVEDSTKEELYNLRKMTSKRGKIRQNALVKFNEDVLETYRSTDEDFVEELRFVYLGEIPNMPGHCIIGGYSGKIHFGIHTNDLVELSEDEI